MVSRRDDPSRKQKVIYSLTEASIALVPLLAHMGGWGLLEAPAPRGSVFSRLQSAYKAAIAKPLV